MNEEKSTEVKKVNIIEEATEVETKIGDDGKASAIFKGIDLYKPSELSLIEIEAPPRYNKLEKEFVIYSRRDGKTGQDILKDGLDKLELNGVLEDLEVTVENNSGVELPKTGGMGTRLFAVLGGGVILISLYSLVKGKMKKERK